MEKYEDVEIILNAISKMVGVHFTIKDRTIVVTDKKTADVSASPVVSDKRQES